MYAVLLHLRIKARLPSVEAKYYTWSNLGDETIQVWSVRHYLRPQMPWLLSDRVALSLNVVSQTCKIWKEPKLGWNQRILKLLKKCWTKIILSTNIFQFGATKYWKSGSVGKSVKVSLEETRTWHNATLRCASSKIRINRQIYCHIDFAEPLMQPSKININLQTYLPIDFAPPLLQLVICPPVR